VRRLGRTAAGWAVLALVGLVIACGAAYAASRLATQPIGLASEPITAGRALAPRSGTAPHRRGEDPGDPTPTPSPTATGTAVPTAPPATAVPTAAATAPPATITPAPHDDSGGGRRDGDGDHDDD
jgi:hypothetical protein